MFVFLCHAFNGPREFSSVGLFACVFVCLFVCMFCLFNWLVGGCSSVLLAVCLFVCLFAWSSVCLVVCLSGFVFSLF